LDYHWLPVIRKVSTNGKRSEVIGTPDN